MENAMMNPCPSRRGVKSDWANNSVFQFRRLTASGARTLPRRIAMSADPIAATRAAAIDPCRDSSTTEGIQIHPIALESANRLMENEELIRDGAQINQVAATPERTAAET